MFGAALFGFGLLLWSIRSGLADVSNQTTRGILFGLLLANLMGAFVSITQQSSVWNSTAGWIATALFTLLALGYLYYLIIHQRISA